MTYGVSRQIDGPFGFKLLLDRAARLSDFGEVGRNQAGNLHRLGVEQAWDDGGRLYSYTDAASPHDQREHFAQVRFRQGFIDQCQRWRTSRLGRPTHADTGDTAWQTIWLVVDDEPWSWEATVVDGASVLLSVPGSTIYALFLAGRQPDELDLTCVHELPVEGQPASG